MKCKCSWDKRQIVIREAPVQREINTGILDASDPWPTTLLVPCTTAANQNIVHWASIPYTTILEAEFSCLETVYIQRNEYKP